MTQDIKTTVTELFDEFEDFKEWFFREDAPQEGRKYNSDKVNEFIYRTQKLELTYELVDSHGGEGEGEDFWTVYKFTQGTDSVHVQFDGYYQSYDGSTFQEWFFVEPKEVVVTKFFKVE